MEIGKDTFVILEYTLRLGDGTYVKGSAENGPASLNFVVGYDQILPSLELQLLGVAEGTRLQLDIPPEEAFGAYQQQLVECRSLAEFPLGRDLEAGKWVMATNDTTNARYSYFVKEKSQDAVTLDFNHPLAGKTLHYTIHVDKVRPASAEELAYLRPCQTEESASKPSPSD
jgi:FKBP-type peptidyl-prolyl cis-trans isomerase SlyD